MIFKFFDTHTQKCVMLWWVIIEQEMKARNCEANISFITLKINMKRRALVIKYLSTKTPEKKLLSFFSPIKQNLTKIKNDFYLFSFTYRFRPSSNNSLNKPTLSISLSHTQNTITYIFHF